MKYLKRKFYTKGKKIIFTSNVMASLDLNPIQYPHCTENLRHMFPEIKCVDLFPISTFMYIYVSDLYIPTTKLNSLLQEREKKRKDDSTDRTP
jgi:hypothetical protein